MGKRVRLVRLLRRSVYFPLLAVVFFFSWLPGSFAQINIQMFAPRNGDQVGSSGFGWFVDLRIAFNNLPLEATGFSGFQITGPAGHNNIPPFSGTFSLGKDDRFPGLVVLLSSTTVGAGPGQNISNLFNLLGITHVNAGGGELWNTWIVGAPNFGVNTPSRILVAMVADLNGDGKFNDAPDVVSDSDGNGIIDEADLTALGLASNIARADFFINGDIIPNIPAIGIFRDGSWFLDANGNRVFEGAPNDKSLGPFGGLPGDVPIAGVWTLGSPTKIGIYRNGQWFLDGNGDGVWDPNDFTRGPFGGLPGDLPVVGNWASGQESRIGIYRNGLWLLDSNGNGIWDGEPGDKILGPFGGLPGELPVVGDWTGNGVTRIGVYRQGQWILDANGNGLMDGCGQGDICFAAFGGLPGDIPVTGKWKTIDSADRIGIYRNGQWFLDANSNGNWDGCAVDICVAAFGGLGTDIPITGRW